ncbi:hypothetical protein NFJ02_30g76630 [Pycnococcus provasolii]
MGSRSIVRPSKHESAAEALRLYEARDAARVATADATSMRRHAVARLAAPLLGFGLAWREPSSDDTAKSADGEGNRSICSAYGSSWEYRGVPLAHRPRREPRINKSKFLPKN